MKMRDREKQGLTIDDLLLQPWFLPKRMARAMRSLLPPDFRQRLHDFFDDYGCMRCGRKDVPYQSNGMCGKCIIGVFHKMYASANRRLEDRLPRRYGKEFMVKEQAAKRLLSGLSAGAKVPKQRRRKMVELGNPISAAFETFG